MEKVLGLVSNYYDSVWYHDSTCLCSLSKWVGGRLISFWVTHTKRCTGEFPVKHLSRGLHRGCGMSPPSPRALASAHLSDVLSQILTATTSVSEEEPVLESVMTKSWLGKKTVPTFFCLNVTHFAFYLVSQNCLLKVTKQNMISA